MALATPINLACPAGPATTIDLDCHFFLARHLLRADLAMGGDRPGASSKLRAPAPSSGRKLRTQGARMFKYDWNAKVQMGVFECDYNALSVNVIKLDCKRLWLLIMITL